MDSLQQRSPDRIINSQVESRFFNSLLGEWIESTDDPGAETSEVYRLETEDQIQSTRNKAAREAYRKNAELYKRWAREGK